jgi:hypothetical protein
MIDAAHHKVSTKDEAAKKKWNSHEVLQNKIRFLATEAVAPRIVIGRWQSLRKRRPGGRLA